MLNWSKKPVWSQNDPSNLHQNFQVQDHQAQDQSTDGKNEDVTGESGDRIYGEATVKIEEQYAKSQARMRILEDLQNPEVINAETNPYIYHNEDSKCQLPGEYDSKFFLGMGASHFS